MPLLSGQIARAVSLNEGWLDRVRVLATRYAASVFADGAASAQAKAFATRYMAQPDTFRVALGTAVAGVVTPTATGQIVGTEPERITDAEVTAAITAVWATFAGS